MVVHDCSPPDEALTSPDFVPGEWCGVTYRAYLDFVLARRDLRYLTVDTDYGCGVVRKLKPRAAGFPPCRSRQSGGERARVAAWSGPGLHLATITAPPGACSRNRAELLNLITVAAFRAGAHALDN